MRTSKNPPINPHPASRYRRTDKRTMQLACVRSVEFDMTPWRLLNDACTLARMSPGSEVFTGYFDPKSATVKRAEELSKELNKL